MEVVRFDEEENPEAIVCELMIPCSTIYLLPLPATSLRNAASGDFPNNTQGAVGGWMYVNFDDIENDGRASPAWMTVSMRAENRFSVDFDAASLGNGCSPPIVASEASGYGMPIGPAANWSPP